MLRPCQIAEVKKLLKDGRSHREVERLTGVSRPSIGKIGSGQYRQMLARRADVAERYERYDVTPLTEAEQKAVRDGAERGMEAKLAAKRRRLARERAA
jgi:hypothetical protein